MKKLIMLAVVSLFAFSAAAASACDGMKGHESASADPQAKNDAAKSGAKTNGKTKAGGTKSRSEDGTTKS
jgi:hypothetical protein